MVYIPWFNLMCLERAFMRYTIIKLRTEIDWTILLLSCNGPVKNLALDDKCLGQKTSVGETEMVEKTTNNVWTDGCGTT